MSDGMHYVGCQQGSHEQGDRDMSEISHNERLKTIGESTRTVVDRIVATYNRATDTDKERGALWYGDGERLIDDLAAQTGYSREHVAAVVSHLSPRTTWQRNTWGATVMLTTGVAPSALLAANVARAEAALKSEAPLDTFGGPKTRRFARNLLGDREAVTVDVWATRVALGEREDNERILDRKGMYDAIEYAYQVAARRIGVDPVTVQATTWIVARGGRAV
jgi:hypothetical protein